MAKSLQEQLRQAGIANQKQMVKARKAQNTKEKMQRKGVAVADETADAVRQRDEEKLIRDRALNEQKHKATLEKALQAQIRQLIDLNVVTERGDTDFRFDHAGVIKTLALDTQVRQALIKGSLAIVGQQAELSIVPRKVATKISERDASWVILINDEDEQTSEDDEYAGYEVPDDLMW